jgi:chromosome segregation ATPase
MTTQCKSCGGFCGSKCERSNIRGPVGFGQPRKATVIALDDLNAIRKEVEVHKYAADNYRRLMDESDHAYEKLKDERDQALTDLVRCEKGRDAIAKRAQALQDERDALLAENEKLSDMWSAMKAERDGLRKAAQMAVDSYDRNEYDHWDDAMEALREALK